MQVSWLHMKHVVLLKSKGSGGLEKYASRVEKAFVEKGARVTVLSPTKMIWPGFIRLELFDRYVQNWLKENQADVVFGMDRNRFQTHIRAGNGVHAAYLKSRLEVEGRLKRLSCWINPLHRKILEIEKCAFEWNGLRKVFTNSQMVKDQILENYSMEPGKVQVVHNGVEWHEMQSDFDEWEEGRSLGLKKFGLDPDRFYFLFIGHGYLRKGLDRLLIGLSQMKRKDVSLLVVGKDKQIDLYRAKAEQLGLKDRVHFFGPSREVSLFYQIADALVIPSFYDPFANVTVEALAMGLFVVSSRTNGGCEILTPENGTVIEDLFDNNAMIQALEIALMRCKTKESAGRMRESVRNLDFSKQMRALVEGAYE